MNDFQADMTPTFHEISSGRDHSVLVARFPWLGLMLEGRDGVGTTHRSVCLSEKEERAGQRVQRAFFPNVNLGATGYGRSVIQPEVAC